VSLAARTPGGPVRAEFVPYIHGATLGCPSRGRPEKVLAHLTTTTTTRQEDGVGIKPAPGSQPRNGRPERGGYVYRGTGEDTLTAGLGDWRLRFEARAAVPAPAGGFPKPARMPPVRRPPEPEPESAPVPVPAAGATAPKPGRQRRGVALTTACPGCGRPKPDKYVTCAGTGPCLAPRQAPEPAPVHAKLTAGRLEPGHPHRYAPDPPWPGCWCGSADQFAPVHGGRAGR
jgi:hypothetical protein